MTRGRALLAECRDCGLPIRFVKLPNDRVIPVNPRPDPRGNVSAHETGGRLHGHVISHQNPAGPLDDRYIPHAATCTERPRKPSNPPTEPPPALF